MLARNVRFGLVPFVVAAILPLAASTAIAKDKQQESDGRAASWRTETQGAPSVEVCRKKVAKNPQDAEAQNDLGWALRQSGDIKGAEESLRTSIKLNDTSPYPHSHLSVVLLDSNNASEALSEAKRAVALDGKQPIFRVVLGNALEATGDRKAAIAEYREALRLRPDYENALYKLGHSLNEDGQNTEAKLVLSEALRLDPNDDRVLKILDSILQ
jgi:Flp pilus assembly protein TadD